MRSRETKFPSQIIAIFSDLYRGLGLFSDS